jgi:hypothetical protein
VSAGQVDLPFFGGTRVKEYFSAALSSIFAETVIFLGLFTAGKVSRYLLFPLNSSAFRISLPPKAKLILPGLRPIAGYNLLKGFTSFFEKDGAFLKSTLMVLYSDRDLDGRYTYDQCYQKYWQTDFLHGI